MGLELPSELTEPLGWIGMTWPEADEEKLFAAGQTWLTYGATLRTQAAQAQSTAEQVWTQNQGDAADAFQRWWSTGDGPGAKLGENAVAAELIGAGLVVMAGITLALKIAFIAQLIALAIEVAQAIATAFVTFGATTAEIPGFVALTRTLCREALDKVIAMVEREIAELFGKAGTLLEKAGAKDLARSSDKLAGKLTGKAQDRMFASLFSRAERVDVSTARDGSIFYSGEDDAGKRMFNYAEESADSSGRNILETTKGGREFNDMNLYDKDVVSRDQADQIWRSLSSRYGESASGDTEVLLHQGNPNNPLSGRIFMTRELQALRDNPKVTSVLVRDPATGYTRAFTRDELTALGSDLSSVLPPGSR
jgi:hypothetical protein